MYQTNRPTEGVTVIVYFLLTEPGVDMIVNKGRVTIEMYLPVFAFDNEAFESQGDLTRNMCRELQAVAHLYD